MTARFLALYETPADPAAFDRHYREVHIPLGSRLPGLRRYTVGRDVAAVRGDTPYYMVAELEWDTLDELRAAFASPEGRATAADAARLQQLAPVHSMVFTADDNVMQQPEPELPDGADALPWTSRPRRHSDASAACPPARPPGFYPDVPLTASRTGLCSPRPRAGR